MGFADNFGPWLDRHASGITTGASIIGFVTTVVLAVKATPEAHDIYLDACERLEHTKSDRMAKKIKTKAAKDMGKLYLPSGISGALTILSIIGTKKLSFSSGEQLGIGAAQVMMNNAILDYRREVREELGEKREREIHERALERKYQREGSERPIIFTSKDGTYLCYDSICKTKFRSNQNLIKTAILNINKRLQNEDEVTVADLYSELGLPYGLAQEKLYWTIKDGLIEEYYRYDQYDEDTGEPMCVLHFYTEPDTRR